MNAELTAELFSAIQNEYQAEAFIKLIDSRPQPQPKVERNTKKSPLDSSGKYWSDEDITRLIEYRREGMGPAEIVARGLFPDRSNAAVRYQLKRIYKEYPELRDSEMARRSMVQYESISAELDTDRFKNRLESE